MHKKPSKFSRWIYFYKEYKHFMVLSFLLKQSSKTFDLNESETLVCCDVLDAESAHVRDVLSRGDPMYSDALLLHYMNNRADYWLRILINKRAST